MKKLMFIVSVLLLFFSMNYKVTAQEHLVTLSQETLENWQSLFANGMSDNGDWIGYRLRCEKSDTLFVKNIHSEKTYVFPNARQGRFLGNHRFACLSPEQTLQIIDLGSGIKKEILNVNDYQPVNGGKLLLAEYLRDDYKTLSLLALDGSEIWKMEYVVEYSLSESLDKIAYSAFVKDAYQLRIISLDKEKQEVFSLFSQLPINVFSWHDGGRSIAFAPVDTDEIGNRTNEEIFFYDFSKDKLHVLRNNSIEMPVNMQLAPIFLHDFKIADDGERLFLALRHLNNSNDYREAGIQIWNTLDKESYPVNELRKAGGEYLFSVWQPSNGSLDLIGTKMSEEVILAGNQKVALVYDFKEYQPTLDHHPDRDIYLKDLSNGEKKIFLERFSGFDEMLSVSPAGKYIAYFREGDWWQYTIATGTHSRVSRKELSSLEQEGFDRPGQIIPAGAPLWTLNDSEILYYDQRDIWKYNPETNRRVRLTKGKESGMVFRFYNTVAYPSVHFQKEASVNLNEPIVLQGRSIDHMKTGFFLLQKNLDTLVYTEAKVTGFSFAKSRKSFRYIEQRSNLSPQIVVGKVGSASKKIIISSNTASVNYDIGSSQILKYLNKEGVEMRAILYFPAQYNPNKKYPMIVSVYERQSHRIHDYVSPTFYNQTGFNPALFTSAEYFVLLPDINYKLGSVGNSALECVVAATEYAIGIASINRQQLGLIGASFGGFETNFIISQTNLFAAAVSGSSMNDFISGYFSLNQNDKLFDSWRYTTHQPRMNSSPFENWSGYLKNSPLYHAQDINTPLLMWIGSNDVQVEPSQSTSLFSALRHLKKECVLLVYEGDEHALQQRNNQKNLTIKILEWFAYRLKSCEKPNWVQPF